jgi:hypothetical protein
MGFDDTFEHPESVVLVKTSSGRQRDWSSGGDYITASTTTHILASADVMFGPWVNEAFGRMGPDLSEGEAVLFAYHPKDDPDTMEQSARIETSDLVRISTGPSADTTEWEVTGLKETYDWFRESRDVTHGGTLEWELERRT